VMMSMQARRRFGRAPIKARATCTANQRRFEGTVWQIGEGGLLVELPPTENLPLELAVQFEIPGHGVHRVIARPIWVTEKPPRTAPDATRAAGCEFADASPKTREAVAAYVKKTKETYRSLQFALALDRPTPQLPTLLRETGLNSISDRRELKDRIAKAIEQLQQQT
jgi:hypothetical protein